MKEFKRPKTFVSIGEAKERDTLAEAKNAEIAKYAPMAEKVRELKVRDFEPETPVMMEKIARKLDKGDFLGAKLLLYEYIGKFTSQDYRDIQKAMGLIDQNGKLAV